MITINGVQYENHYVSVPVYNKRDVSLVRLAEKKGIELLYGFKSKPIGIRFNNPNEKIHPKSLARLKDIDIETYRRSLTLK